MNPRSKGLNFIIYLFVYFCPMSYVALNMLQCGSEHASSLSCTMRIAEGTLTVCASLSCRREWKKESLIGDIVFKMAQRA